MCFIVNDLTNRELIRRKFTFNQPNFHKIRGPANYGNDDIDEDDVIEGSTILQTSNASDIQKHLDLK